MKNILTIIIFLLYSVSATATIHISGELNEVVTKVSTSDQTKYATGYYDGTLSVDGFNSSSTYHSPFLLSFDNFVLNWARTIDNGVASRGVYLATSDNNVAITTQSDNRVKNIFFNKDGETITSDQIVSNHAIAAGGLFFSGTEFYHVGTFLESIHSDNYDVNSPTFNRYLYLIKYDENGNPRLARSLDKADNVKDAVGISDGFAVCGSYNRNIFVSTYNTDGTRQTMLAFGSPGLDECRGIVNDGDSIFITGSYGLGTDLPLDHNNISLPTNGNANDIFLAKLNSNLEILWISSFGGDGDDIANGISIFNNKIVLVGQFQLTADFGGTPLTSFHGIDAFLAQFSKNGDYISSDVFGSFVTDKATSVHGDIFSGYFLHAINLGNGQIKSNFTDSFIAKIPGQDTPTSTPTSIPDTQVPTQMPTQVPQTPTPSPTETPTPTGTPEPTETISLVTISGTVFYKNNIPIPGASIFDNNNLVTTSGPDGTYSFTVPISTYRVIHVEKPAQLNRSLSSLDATWILQAVVGNRTLSTFQRYAADLTGNGTVSSYDAFHVLQYITGRISSFPVCSGDAWTFFPELNGVPPIINSDSCEPGFSNIVADEDSIFNFRGVLFGDVTESWLP